MIRNATLADMPQMLANARTFIDASPYKGLCDDASMEKAFISMMEDGLLLVDALEDGTHLGGVGAAKHSFFFNQSVSAAIERFWWVCPDERSKGVGGGLLKAIRKAAKEAGCDYWVMISLNSPQVDAIYKSIGLEEVEHSFIGRL